MVANSAGPISDAMMLPGKSWKASGFSTPILLLVFNRPDTTRVVFESIRSMRPVQLYVAADGPRRDAPEDAPKCESARGIATTVDWDCRLQTLFRDTNLGLAAGVSSAITWFFDHVNSGIILEDDCVPSRTFYRFCQELLAFYRDDARVMHISGDNFQYGRSRGPASYYFSKYAHCWGWATWNRAWQHFSLPATAQDEPWLGWANTWQSTVAASRGLSILPNVNLVRNIGFGPGATHTKKQERYAYLAVQEMEFPLVHPKAYEIDATADRFTYYVHFRNVRHPRLIPIYQIWDSLISTMKLLKRRMRKLVGSART